MSVLVRCPLRESWLYLRISNFYQTVDDGTKLLMSYCFVVQMGFIVTPTNSFHFTDDDKKHSKTTNILLTSFVAASPLSLHSLSLVWPIH